MKPCRTDSRSLRKALILSLSKQVLFKPASDTDLTAGSIVAVHGLNGHREKTWTAHEEVNWLRDFLPLDIPKARILTWGYDANTHSTSRISAQYIYDHARTLVSDLSLKRSLTEVQEPFSDNTRFLLRTFQTRTRPIVFVAHSLGGIVVKSVGFLTKLVEP